MTKETPEWIENALQSALDEWRGNFDSDIDAVVKAFVRAFPYETPVVITQQLKKWAEE